MTTDPNEGAPRPALEDRVATQLEAIVNKRLAADQLVLPALPAVALKCLKLIKDPDFALGDAATLIEKDPILAARLIRTASSAALAGREPVKSVLASVTRIGVKRLRELLIEASARQVFESRDPRIGAALKGLWDHSRVVATLARDVVTLSNSGDADLGYLAGLLHDIGKPVVAALLLETERALQDAGKKGQWITGTQWVGILQRCHQKVGLALAMKWEMPEPVQRAVRDSAEYEDADGLSIANCVRFANALAKQNGVYVGEVSKDSVDAQVASGRAVLNIDDPAFARLNESIGAILKDG
ncbi:MAG TPA: HDOD domain-containing protein [Polyangia bacterium]